MRERTTKKVDSEKKSDYFLIQLILCIAIITLFLFLRFFDNAFFENIINDYRKIDQNSIKISAIVESFGNFAKGQINLVSDEAQDDSAVSTTNPDQEVTNPATTSGYDVTATVPAIDDNRLQTTPPMGGGDDSNQPLAPAITATKTPVNQLAVPVTGWISSGYGYRTDPITGEYEFHGGLDLAADAGQPIHAAMDGTVIVSKEVEDYGKYLVIQHSTTLKTYYAHCKSLKVKEGKAVRKGDVIALVGSTGQSTGPHLHFEVRINNKRINPGWVLEV